MRLELALALSTTFTALPCAPGGQAHPWSELPATAVSSTGGRVQSLGDISNSQRNQKGKPGTFPCPSAGCPEEPWLTYPLLPLPFPQLIKLLATLVFPPSLLPRSKQLSTVALLRCFGKLHQLPNPAILFPLGCSFIRLTRILFKFQITRWILYAEALRNIQAVKTSGIHYFKKCVM